jgi:hypothetical protein
MEMKEPTQFHEYFAVNLSAEQAAFMARSQIQGSHHHASDAGFHKTTPYSGGALFLCEKWYCKRRYKRQDLPCRASSSFRSPTIVFSNGLSAL